MSLEYFYYYYYYTLVFKTGRIMVYHCPSVRFTCHALTCKDFLSHNSWMKNLNFTKKYTDRKTINSNNCAKFEVNWPKGSQFTAWHMQKSPSIWRIKSHNSGMKNWNFTIKYTDRKTINSNNSFHYPESHKIHYLLRARFIQVSLYDIMDLNSNIEIVSAVWIL
jgi:hypothetical protein